MSITFFSLFWLFYNFLFNLNKKLNLNYRETNSIDTIQNVYDGENNLGIVRFPLRDQDYYFNILNLKELS